MSDMQCSVNFVKLDLKKKPWNLCVECV